MYLKITTNRLYKHTTQPIEYILKCDSIYMDNTNNVIAIDSEIYELNVICEISIKVNGLYRIIYTNGKCKLYSSNVNKYDNKIQKYYTKYNVKKFYDMFK